MPTRSPHKGSLLVIFLTVFVDLLGFGIVLPLLPLYAKAFTEDKSGFQLGLLMASFSAMQFFFAPLWGRVSDRYGRRPVIMVGLAGSVVFYSLFGVATVLQSLGLLFVSRVGAGISGATISTAQAYIADSTTHQQRPKGMALIGMAFALSFTLGPLIGFLAVPSGGEKLGPWPGYVAAALSAIALGMAWFLLPESRQASDDQRQHRIFDWAALREALTVASVPAILLVIFLTIFSFGNFETILALLLQGSEEIASPFKFNLRQVCLVFAYIGLVSAIVQGGIVRRLAGRISEAVMASTGAVLQIVGFLLLLSTTGNGSMAALMIALTVVVAGFGFLSPSLQSLLSRRTDSERQGSVLGVGQSVSSLARIVGSGLGIPLLTRATSLPFYVAGGCMVISLLLIVFATRSGRDFPSDD